MRGGIQAVQGFADEEGWGEQEVEREAETVDGFDKQGPRYFEEFAETLQDWGWEEQGVKGRAARKGRGVDPI